MTLNDLADDFNTLQVMYDVIDNAELEYDIHYALNNYSEAKTCKNVTWND